VDTGLRAPAHSPGKTAKNQPSPQTPNLVSLLCSEWKDLEQQIVAMNLEVEQVASGLHWIAKTNEQFPTACSQPCSRKWSSMTVPLVGMIEVPQKEAALPV
jgi:hypothetical protein